MHARRNVLVGIAAVTLAAGTLILGAVFWRYIGAVLGVLTTTQRGLIVGFLTLVVAFHAVLAAARRRRGRSITRELRPKIGVDREG